MPGSPVYVCAPVRAIGLVEVHGPAGTRWVVGIRRVVGDLIFRTTEEMPDAVGVAEMLEAIHGAPGDQRQPVPAVEGTGDPRTGRPLDPNPNPRSPGRFPSRLLRPVTIRPSAPEGTQLPVFPNPLLGSGVNFPPCSSCRLPTSMPRRTPWNRGRLRSRILALSHTQDRLRPRKHPSGSRNDPGPLHPLSHRQAVGCRPSLSTPIREKPQDSPTADTRSCLKKRFRGAVTMTSTTARPGFLPGRAPARAQAGERPAVVDTVRRSGR